MCTRKIARIKGRGEEEESKIGYAIEVPETDFAMKKGKENKTSLGEHLLKIMFGTWSPEMRKEAIEYLKSLG